MTNFLLLVTSHCINMCQRMGPWMGDKHNSKKRPKVAKAYHNSKHKVLGNYSYLFDDMHTNRDYMSLYCPRDVLHGGGNYVARCNEARSADNGVLRGRFERFVEDYDGYAPFDVQ